MLIAVPKLDPMTVYFLLCFSALTSPLGACKACCGSCTKPSCLNRPGGGPSERYFPHKDGKQCTAYRPSSGICKGKFYATKTECQSCCKSYLS
uniref:Putative secreted protein n=1 Tax=Amblyomma triste TaxID=251400 RepID=A0A023G3T3_AMBTT